MPACILRLLPLVLSCSALAAQQSPPPAMVYRIDEIPFAGTGDYLWPAAMNATQVVGGANETAGGAPQAFLFAAGTVALVGTFPGGDESFAWGINAHGTIVGTSDHGLFGELPFVKKDGDFMQLPLQAGQFQGEARAVNDDGKIAGDVTTTTGRRAVRWPKWSLVAPESLAYLQRGHTVAYGHAINSLGWVAGSSGTSALDQTAVLWKTTSVTNLGVPATWTRSEAYGVNEDGWVAGTTTVANGDTRAFLYKPATGVTLLPNVAGSDHGRANGINDLGWVVGTSGGKAIVWINGWPHDVTNRIYNFAGWTGLMQFTATNDQRGFTGLGVKDFTIRGFRLVPVSN